MNGSFDRITAIEPENMNFSMPIVLQSFFFKNAISSEFWSFKKNQIQLGIIKKTKKIK
jgi:hypothetical protein